MDKVSPPLGSQASDSSSDHDYSHIELSEQELKEAFRAGREEKHFRLMREEYGRKLRETPTYPTFTAEQLFDRYAAITNADGKPFSSCMSEEFEKIVKWICCYFAGDARFESRPDLRLSKGLLLCGGVGIGKSTIMKLFQRNQICSYRVISCRDVEGDFAALGEDALREYSTNTKIALNSDPFGHQQLGYCFDDLGTEDTAKHYGRVKNVMQSVILNRYDVGDIPLNTTHITTNLSDEELKVRYDDRAIDRMREMFNIIEFPLTEKSRRK